MLGPRQRGIALDDPRRRPARGLEQRQIALQVGVAQRDAAVLAGARELTHAALLQVQFGDLEAVRRLGEGAQPPRRLGDVAQQDAVTLRRAAAHPAAQLVQLRQSEPLGVLDQHDARVRHVDPHLDHAGRDEDVDRVVAERPHRDVALVRVQPAVHQADAELGKGPRQPFRHRGRRLEVGALRLLDHGIDHVGLPPGRALAPDETVDLVPRALRAERRLDAPPPRGPLA